jgi:hypothetical protein
MEFTRRPPPSEPLPLLRRLNLEGLAAWLLGLAMLAQRLLRRMDREGLAMWLLGFGLVAYLGLNGGGYDPVVRNQAGIAVWWIVLLGVAIGVMPVRRPGRAALISWGLLAAYVIWVALSVSWSDTSERTVADLGRVATYLGVFALALLVTVGGSQSARRLLNAVGAAVVVVTVVALLSRLHPAWFPTARQTANALGGTSNRLSYPVNYWNGLAALVAIGILLLLYAATSARTMVMRALAAAALPAMALTIFFTYSRGGAAATTLGLVIFIAFVHDRLPKLSTLLAAGTGAVILIAAALQRDALQNGLLNPVAREQGNEMLAMTLIVCAGVALIQVAISLVERSGWRPAWRLDRKEARRLYGPVAVFLVVTAIGANLPGKASNAWREFKSPEVAGLGPARFQSFRGNHRYQLWTAALDENGTDPLEGTGSGTFEYWWAQNGSQPLFVRDAHSLYIETLGELGIVGFAFLVCFLLWSLRAGLLRWVRAAPWQRTQLAAALAGSAAFCLVAAVDWVWELAVVPVVFLLLISVLVSAGDRQPEDGFRLPILGRLVTAGFAIVAMVVIAVPLASTIAIDQSQARVRSYDLSGALSAARTAQNVQPYAATPRLQEALVLALRGELESATAAARAATQREPTNWRTWLILSRIETRRGNAPAATSDYRKARSLNPRSPLFAQ